MNQFRRENLVDMTNEWLIDSVKGFNHPDCNPSFGAMQMWDMVPNDFASAPDIAWYAYRPLFKHHVCDEGIYLTLKHIKQYNMEWGIPVAPEARWKSPYPALWGDQYSNFNAGKIDLLIEGIGGLNYSFEDSTFTYGGHLPKEWTFMEWRVPVKHHEWAEPVWVVARSEKTLSGSTVTKTSSVTNNPMKTLHIHPWNEGKSITSVLPVNGIENDSNHVEAIFTDMQNAEVVLTWEDTTAGPILNFRDITHNHFSLSPNPVKDVMTLTLPHRGIDEVIITDVLGKTYYQQHLIGQEKLQVNVGHLPKGIYLCQFKTHEQSHSIKFIKD